jgi:ATP-dependent Clp protease ATP-binding subunit ClpB
MESRELDLPHRNHSVHDDANITLSVQKLSPFSLSTLAAALDHKCSFEAIKTYLYSYNATTVQNEIGERINKLLIISHAIQRNDCRILRFSLEYDSVSPSSLDFCDIPVLAFAIMRSNWSNDNTTDVVKTLLAFGADPDDIPKDLWTDYIRTPIPTIVFGELERTPSINWCTFKKRRVLAETLNLTMRYSLWRAARMEPTKERKKQMSKAHRISPLLRAPYGIIGQEIATKLVVDHIFGHITMNRSKPLVLAFAGLSGHGKTELASQLGVLLSSDFIDIDCTQTSTLFSLLGPTCGYQDHEIGSPLNNFLAGSADQRRVVFLDEYDKTEKAVRDALSKVMDSGNIVLLSSQLTQMLTKTQVPTVKERPTPRSTAAKSSGFLLRTRVTRKSQNSTQSTSQTAEAKTSTRSQSSRCAKSYTNCSPLCTP